MATPRPDLSASTLVAPAPGAGDGYWAGAPSSAPDGSRGVALAYRVRAGHDGSDRNVVARSSDGVVFETVAELPSSRFGARWVERPTLLRTPEGRWRLYVCCAAPTDPSWWVEALEADDLAGLAGAESRVVMPATGQVARKDPVVVVGADGTWRAWVCAHLLDQPGAEDRMRTDYATSDDGFDWSWHGPVLEGRPARWDARGARITAVLPDGRVLYDGRATAEQNWFERSGVAVPDGSGRLAPDDAEPVLDVRYVDVLPLADGSSRLYFEARLPDLSHELRTSLFVG
jgi:hypothetical protein